MSSSRCRRGHASRRLSAPNGLLTAYSYDPDGHVLQSQQSAGANGSALTLARRLRIDNLTAAASYADGYAGAERPRRIFPFRIGRVFVGVVGFAGHFQTGQKLDIARETGDRRHGETGASCRHR